MSDERRTVFLTGATGKLGRTFALGFAGLGWDVAYASRSTESAEALEKECLELGSPRVIWVQSDLTSPGASLAIVEVLAKAHMLPDTLVNNARNVAYLQPQLNGHIGRASWDGELLLGIVVPYELTMALADAPKSPLRKVINISSIYGVTAPNLSLYLRPELESPINYGVAKAGLIHLTKELAVRLALRHISVNSISYGGVEGRADGAFMERYGKLCPSGGMLKESEVFGAVKFLSSQDASGMTGHNLVVDGGWTAW